MARLAKLSPGLFDEEQKRLYETITAGPRADGRQSFQLVDGAGALEGHGGAFRAHHPDRVLRHLGASASRLPGGRPGPVTRGAPGRRETLPAAGTGVAPAHYAGWRHAGTSHLPGRVTYWDESLTGLRHCAGGLRIHAEVVEGARNYRQRDRARLHAGFNRPVVIVALAAGQGTNGQPHNEQHRYVFHYYLRNARSTGAVSDDYRGQRRTRRRGDQVAQTPARWRARQVSPTSIRLVGEKTTL